MFRERRIIVTLATGKAVYFALVLLEQADRVVLGVGLKEDQAETIFADRQMNTRRLILHQYPQPRRLKLFAADLIITGMGHVEPGIHPPHQRMPAVCDMV